MCFRTRIRKCMYFFIPAFVVVYLVSCATFGRGEGRGIATSGFSFNRQSLYYPKSSKLDLQEARIGYFPIVYARVPGESCDSLLINMNQFLEENSWVTKCHPYGPREEAPYIYIGSDQVAWSPCYEDRNESDPSHIIYWHDGGKMWNLQLSKRMSRYQLDYVIQLELGLSDCVLERNLFSGGKFLLGTGWEIKGSWFFSQEIIQVLRVTGILLDRQGKICRVGGECILHAESKSGVIESIQRVAFLTDEDVQNAHTKCRTDLPGEPLSYQVALQNLIANLIDREDLIIKKGSEKNTRSSE